MAQPERDLIATIEVAKLLHVSVATVNRMARDGRLTVALKLPGRRGAQLFDRAAVEAFRDQVAA